MKSFALSFLMMTASAVTFIDKSDRIGEAPVDLPWDKVNPKFGKVVDEDEYNKGQPKGYEVKAQQELPWDTVNKSIGKMVDEDEYNKGQPKGYEVKAQLPPSEEELQLSNQQKLEQHMRHHHKHHSTVGKNSHQYSYEYAVSEDMEAGSDTTAFIDASPAY